MPAASPASFAPDSGPRSAAATPQPVDLILTDIDWLVTCDPAMTVIESGAVAIRGDRIVALGPTDQLTARFAAAQRVALTGHLLLPGLVNTHAHAAMSLFRGLADDLPLERWLFEVIFPAESRHMNADRVHLGTLLAGLEMLQGGITTCCDGYFFEEAAALAFQETGMRAVLGQGVVDFPAPDLADPSRLEDRLSAFAEAFPHADGRLKPGLFCHAPYTCGPATLQRVKGICRERDWLFQIHLNETRDETVRLTAEHGEPPTLYLDRLGVLDHRTLCAHAVWMQREEIERLAERRTAVSHNVHSNMKLASGVAPVPAMLEAGITVGLGTDGCASNNTLDLFREMDRTAKLHKAVSGDPTVCPARQVLHLATLGGAAALGLAELTGSIEAGKKADLVALDLRQPHLTPLYDPVSHLVYCARASDVTQVWIDGRRVVQDRRVLTLDGDEVRREAAAAGAMIGRGR